ncbi:MAG: cupredoxin domain-containing protein [Acidimicrobiales bacterium]
MTRRRRWSAAAAVVVWAALPTTAAAGGGSGGGGSGGGGGGGGGGGVCPAFGSGGAVDMRDNCFSPIAQFVGTGEVSIRNAGLLEHNLTAVDGSFTTGSVRPGGETRLTFRTPGLLRIYCTLHGTASGEGMAGVLVVGSVGDQAAALPAVAAAGSPTSGIGDSSFLLGALAVAAVGAAAVLARRHTRAAA